MNIEETIRSESEILYPLTGNITNDTVNQLRQGAYIYGANRDPWIKVAPDRLPEKDPECDGESLEVLIIGSKRGEREKQEYIEIAWYNHKTGKWCQDGNKDIESNQDMWWVTHYQPITPPKR